MSSQTETAAGYERFAAHAGYDERLGLGERPQVTDPVCARIDALIDELGEQNPAVALAGPDGDAVVLARLRDVSVLLDRLEGHRLGVLRAAEQSGVLQRDGFANASVWLRRSTSLTRPEAGRRGKVTRRLHALPEIAAALEDGRIGVAHASLIDRLAGDVGVDHVAAVQHPLIVAAVRLRDVAEFATLCAGWRHALAPDYLDERDQRNWERRRAGFATINGRGQLWGSFDAHGSALFAAAVDALMTEDGPENPEDARRTREQRVADAITDMAARVLDSGDAPEKAGQRPHVTVTLGADTLAGQPAFPVTPAAIRRSVRSPTTRERASGFRCGQSPRSVVSSASQAVTRSTRGTLLSA